MRFHIIIFTIQNMALKRKVYHNKTHNIDNIY